MMWIIPDAVVHIMQISYIVSWAYIMYMMGSIVFEAIYDDVPKKLRTSKTRSKVMFWIANIFGAPYFLLSRIRSEIFSVPEKKPKRRKKK